MSEPNTCPATPYNTRSRTSKFSMSSPAARVLHSKEVMCQIFSLNSQQDNARCARVCRFWQSLALDRVWATLDDLKPLLQILVPFTTDSSKSYSDVPTLSFSRKLNTIDWGRFLPYARRVRRLTIEPSPYLTHPNGYLGEAVFAELSRTCPESHLLSNLITLEVHQVENEWSKLYDLILRKGLSHLTINLVEWHADAVDSLSASLLSQSPKLISLVIDFPVTSNMEVALLSRFISNCTTLERLEIGGDGPIEISPKLLEALGLLPNLRMVYKPFRNEAETSYPPRASEKNSWGFRTLQIVNAFPRTEQLMLTGNLKELKNLFRSPNSFRSLTKLRINDRFSSHSRSLFAFLGTLADTCTTLQHLSIEDWTRNSPEDTPRPYIDNRTDGPITYNSLSPLTSLTNLRVFELTHANPVNMSDASLAEIFKECPSLTVLRLNSSPVTTERTTSLTLGVLPLLAERCSSLSELSLFLDTAKIPEAPLFESSLPNLRVLDLGKTTVFDADAVASYICQAIPPTCMLEGGVVRLDTASLKVKSQLARLSDPETQTIHERIKSRRMPDNFHTPENSLEERLRLSEEYKWNIAKTSLELLRRFMNSDVGVLLTIQDESLLQKVVGSFQKHERISPPMDEAEAAAGYVEDWSMLSERLSTKTGSRKFKDPPPSPRLNVVKCGHDTTALEAKILALKEEVVAAKSRSSYSLHETAAINWEIAILKNENEILRRRDRTVTEDVASLQDQLDLAKKTNAALKSDKAAVREESEASKAENAILKSEVAMLRYQVYASNDENVVLKSQSASSSGSIEVLMHQNAILVNLLDIARNENSKSNEDTTLAKIDVPSPIEEIGLPLEQLETETDESVSTRRCKDLSSSSKVKVRSPKSTVVRLQDEITTLRDQLEASKRLDDISGSSGLEMENCLSCSICKGHDIHRDEYTTHDLRTRLLDQDRVIDLLRTDAHAAEATLQETLSS
ncbi:hypothetical protein EW145_g4162 [Phellinidium pouzarii]|uniref:F-box domain-containing protein n=1 Tax=Phellinidium pouzarii TaxID=167371 RepID=A0A4S4L9L7_9AGAM|nr:hypothetical protein EW145_g4162 [Phellinidium pouzarii]